MKVTIEASSQEEFEEKREDLLKAIAGNKVDVVIKGAKTLTIYDHEKPAIAPRRAVYRAQNQMMDYWDMKFHAMLAALKREIAEVIDG